MQHLKQIYTLAVTGFICLVFFLGTQAVAEEKPIHPDYPFVFNATGKITRISAKEMQIVIDDTLYRLTNQTTYHSYDIVFANLRSFNAQDMVGVLLTDKDEIDIQSLWLINKAEKPVE